jgi:triosephosphate isomerase
MIDHRVLGKAMPPLIGTSWKMNLTSSEAEGWLRSFAPLVDDLDDRELFVLPPFPALWVARRELARTSVAWGAQDVHPEDRGAHTGDVSAEMLADLGCTFVEMGHSERRSGHGETDALVGGKVRTALRWGLTPIVCVGEPRRVSLLAARSAVGRRLAGALGDLAGPDLDRIVVAYEPAWAIGVGATAAPLEHIGAMHASIRRWLAGHGSSASRIIYGGSIDTANAGAILGTPGVDGLFVGRAALDPHAFAEIAHAGTDATAADGTTETER